MTKPEYFFNNVNDLISYLITEFDDPTDVKIEKSLYFLWAFYVAIFGDNGYAQPVRDLGNYPKYLFPASFWGSIFGPELVGLCWADYNNKIKNANKDNTYNPVPKNTVEQDVWDFIDETIRQLNLVNDDTLIELSRDNAWEKAYRSSAHTLLNEDDIVNAYKNHVKN